jgi:hypothetical protein
MDSSFMTIQPAIRLTFQADGRRSDAIIVLLVIAEMKGFVVE